MKLLTIILALHLFIFPSCAATKFSYKDSWETELTSYSEEINLREASSDFGFQTEWDGKYIWVECDYKKIMFDPDFLPSGVKIVNGKTYITENRLNLILDRTSFYHDSELYILDYNGTTFQKYVLASLFRIKLCDQKVYDIIASLLYSIENVGEAKDKTFGAKAYVYTKSEKPIAYIVGNRYGAELAGLITHEAFHVWQWRNYEITGEELPDKAQNYILEKLGMK